MLTSAVPIRSGLFGNSFPASPSSKIFEFLKTRGSWTLPGHPHSMVVKTDNGGRTLHYHRMPPFPVVEVVPFVLGSNYRYMGSISGTTTLRETHLSWNPCTIQTKSSPDGRVRYCGPRATLTAVTNSTNMLQAVDILMPNNSSNVL